MADFPPGAFEREDDSPDEAFYSFPRFVTHIDAGAIARVSAHYRQRFPSGGAILDLMSSWVSHLPDEVSYSRVAGLGMNREELARNPRLTDYCVQDLNLDPRLPYADAVFDGCAICVSIDYLVRPVDVLREAARVLRPGASLVITFSNRCFPTKAIRSWLASDDAGHVRLVRRYLELAGGFERIDEDLHCPPLGDPLFALIASRAADGGC